MFVYAYIYIYTYIHILIHMYMYTYTYTIDRLFVRRRSTMSSPNLTQTIKTVCDMCLTSRALWMLQPPASAPRPRLQFRCVAVCYSVCVCACVCMQHTLQSEDHVSVFLPASHGSYPWAHCNTLQHTATHCNALLYTATHCNTLQHTAIHCNTLQHTATHCNTL